MVKRNPNLSRLCGGYLFPRINRKKKELIEKNPDAGIISLGIGDTTEPLTPHIGAALADAASNMTNRAGYMGYGDEQGMSGLRQAISKTLYGFGFETSEVFVSDGAKCDIARLQLLFGCDAKIAVQDPSYPVYVDGSVIIGASAGHEERTGQYGGIIYLPCTSENGFFPDLEAASDADIIYFCSPNNPTGACATRKQLKKLIDFARENNQIIIYDAAYSSYISDPDIPRSIYEVEGSRHVAIEVNSFSKSAGFTGLRLGWTICPKQLVYDDGSSVNADWNRLACTVFNGASNIVQKAGMAALSPKGMEEIRETVGFYMENASIILSALKSMGIESYGGVNAPYIWARFPDEDSWDVFDRILDCAHVVTTPGAGFGPAGRGYVRFSAFGKRADIIEATKRLEKCLL